MPAARLHRCRFDGVGGGGYEALYDGMYFGDLKSSRHFNRNLLEVPCEAKEVRSDCRGRDWWTTIRHKRRVRVSSIVSDLQEDAAPSGMDG